MRVFTTYLNDVSKKSREGALAKEHNLTYLHLRGRSGEAVSYLYDTRLSDLLSLSGYEATKNCQTNSSHT
jgi:hypothetical protein